MNSTVGSFGRIKLARREPTKNTRKLTRRKSQKSLHKLRCKLHRGNRKNIRRVGAAVRVEDRQRKKMREATGTRGNHRAIITRREDIQRKIQKDRESARDHQKTGKLLRKTTTSAVNTMASRVENVTRYLI